MINTTIKNIDIERPPYSDDYLDECIANVDFVIDLNFKHMNDEINGYRETIDALDTEGYKVVYIHSYPKELRSFLGCKFK